jgi:hypothetical protein
VKWPERSEEKRLPAAEYIQAVKEILEILRRLSAEQLPVILAELRDRIPPDDRQEVLGSLLEIVTKAKEGGEELLRELRQVLGESGAPGGP